MAKLVLDLTNYRETTSSYIPEGTYKLQVEDVETTKSKAGNDMIVLYLRVTEGDQKGATLIERLTLSEKALFRVVAFMQALGIPTPRKRLSLDPQRFVGRYVMADVGDSEPYNGRVNSQVNQFFAVSKNESVEELDTDDTTDADVADTRVTGDEAPTGIDATEADSKPAQSQAAAPVSGTSEPDSDDLDLDEIDL